MRLLLGLIALCALAVPANADAQACADHSSSETRHSARIVIAKRSQETWLYYACWGRRKTYLGKRQEPRYIVPIVRHSIVAYAFGREELGAFPTTSVAVRVRSAATGRVLHEWYGPGFGARSDEVGSVARLWLKASGSVAFSVRSSFPRNWPDDPGTGEIWAIDSHGTRLLERDRAVNAQSLRLTASTLTWTDGDGTRSALLY